MVRRLSGLPIRLRLTFAFATAMAVAFAALGTFIYVEFQGDQAATLDEGLRSRLRDLAARSSDTPAGALAQSGTSGQRLLTPEEARRAVAGETLTIARRRIAGTGDVRIRARRAADGRPVAVAEALRTPDRDLARLRALLLVAGPLALALASFAGYEVAGAALRPVERMRARAASIEAGDIGERLPVGPADDEVGRLGTTLNELLDRLEDAMARERRVVSDASHELRTPLTVLRTELQLALRGDRPAAELREALSGALGETERLTRLADDLLVLARADQGRLPLRRATVDVGELLAARAERLAPDARVEVPDGLAVDADPDRAAQAIDNLLINALRHGGRPVGLHARATDGLVELHVTDSGRGFGGGGAERAFERFNGDGIGLGLAIVEAIASAHGGSAGAADRPEGGADAWIALPRG
jgi:two-component system, OmpR family, sensor kinase